MLMSRNDNPSGVLDIAREIASECVGVQVRMLNRAMSRIYDDVLRPHGVKFSQLNILTVVALRGPIQPVEVARILSLEKSTLSRNLRILEDRGWVESHSGESGNTLQLRLTAAGRRLLKSAAPAWREAQEIVTAALGERVASSIRGAAGRLEKSAGH
jgi:DNA-binding MarR family transcriptional regulator